MKQKKKENTKDYTKDILDNPLEGDETIRKRRRTKKFLIAFSTITSVGLVGAATAVGIIVTKNKNTKPTPTPVVTHTITIEQPTDGDWVIEANGKTDKVVVSYGETVDVKITQTDPRLTSKRYPKLLWLKNSDKSWSTDVKYEERAYLFSCSFVFSSNSDVTLSIEFTEYETDLNSCIYTTQTGGKTMIYDKLSLSTYGQPIKYYYEKESTLHEISRENFNYPITIGSKITKIDDSFLTNCTSFNSDVIFAENSKIKEIGNNFMINCKKFNKALNFPQLLTTIGNGFLWMQSENDTAFNNGNEPGESSEFSIKEVKEIGDGFLANCGKFNSKLNLATVQKIGSDFLSSCKSFNQDILLPLTITTILGNFMTCCDSMKSTLTVDCPESAFARGTAGSDSNTCATNNKEAACLKGGVKIAGEYASKWKNVFIKNDPKEEFQRWKYNEI